MLDGWRLALADVPYEAAEAAAAWWMANETYMPEPAQIRKRALGAMARLPGAYEAWNGVLDDLDHYRAGHRWPERQHHPVVEQAVAALGGWEALKGDRWERVEFLKAFAEFAGQALDSRVQITAVEADGPLSALEGAAR